MQPASTCLDVVQFKKWSFFFITESKNKTLRTFAGGEAAESARDSAVMQLDWKTGSKFQRLGLIRRSGELGGFLWWSKSTYSSSSFWQNSQASGRMMPTVFWLRRSTRSMRRPYSQPLLTSVRLLCSSSLDWRRKEKDDRHHGKLSWQRLEHHTVKYNRVFSTLCEYKSWPHNSSIPLSPKKAPSISLVMPFLCIFSDFNDSIPLKVKLSTTLILLRFISLKWQKAPVINRFLHLASDLKVQYEGAALTGTEAEAVWTL